MIALILQMLTSGFGKILPLLKTYWKPILLVVIVGGSLMYIHHLRDVVSEQNITITRDNTQLQQAADANKVLRDQIDSLNVTITQWSDLSKKQQDQVNDLSSRLQTQHQNTQNQVNLILKDKKPATCDDAIEYLIQAGMGYKK